MGKERASGTKGPEEGEWDSKPITIGLEKAFHPKTVTTHANIHTSVCLSPAYKYGIHTHMVRHLSLSLTHIHIQSSLQTNALLIKYWGVPVASWAEIQFLPSLMGVPVYGREEEARTQWPEKKAQREREDEEEWREWRMRGGTRKGMRNQLGRDKKTGKEKLRVDKKMEPNQRGKKSVILK